MRNYFNYDKPVHFVFPLNGDCLNEYDGELDTNGWLTVSVKVKAPEASDIWINEEKAELSDGYFIGKATLKGYRNTITLTDMHDHSNDTKIAVYRLNNCINKYRISMDDNILFLQDLTENKDIYESLFDNKYLAIVKKAHELYGAKVHINIYYEFTEEDMKYFSGEHKYFNLSMMTDKYKNEWKENSDWLHLSFHARSNCPDRPYENTTCARISEDIELVHREILRFAGSEVIADVTTLHWGASNEAGVHSLREHGYRGLNGYFTYSQGKPLVSYFYPNEVIDNFLNRDFWVDNDENIVFSSVDIVLNSYKLEQITPLLENLKPDKHNSGFLEFLIHEQYFHKDYVLYIAEYEKIILTAAKWAYEHGYTGAFLGDVMFEGK